MPPAHRICWILLALTVLSGAGIAISMDGVGRVRSTTL